MSELDLGLKIGARKLLWDMGYSTRVNVQLRSHGPNQIPSENAPPGMRTRETKTVHATGRVRAQGPESITDLDVLGVLIAPGFRQTSAIADCKSGRADRPAARMFWLRGVSELFGAHHALLVRQHPVNDAARQLASRLNITVLPATDLASIQKLYQTRPSPDLVERLLFDRAAVAAYAQALTGLDKRLVPLLEYREFDYWIYERHRNPVQLVAHLRDASSFLDARNPIHRALFFDLAWLYLLALVDAAAYIESAFLSEVDRGLQEYLFGGSISLREKLEVAEALNNLAPAGATPRDHLPPYYRPMRELVLRLLRRPYALQTSLRYAELSTALTMGRERVSLRAGLEKEFDAVAAKLLADVCGFLVAAGELDSIFRTHARAVLLGEEDAPSRRARAVPTASRDIAQSHGLTIQTERELRSEVGLKDEASESSEQRAAERSDARAPGESGGDTEKTKLAPADEAREFRVGDGASSSDTKRGAEASEADPASPEDELRRPWRQQPLALDDRSADDSDLEG